jgi:hypothetical protein
MQFLQSVICGECSLSIRLPDLIQSEYGKRVIEKGKLMLRGGEVEVELEREG